MPKWMPLFKVVVLTIFQLSFSHSTQAQEQKLVDNVFFQTDLRQALEDISAQTNENIIADPSVQGIVSVTLEKVTIEQALDLVLAGTGYQVLEQPGYYLVFNPDPSAEAFAEVAETRLVSLDNLKPGSARGLLAQPLQKYVSVDEESGRLAVSAPPKLLNQIVSDLEKLDRRDEQNTSFYALNHVKAENARELLPPDLQRYVRVDTQRNTVAITAPDENRLAAIALLRRLDVPRAPSATEVPDVYPTRLVKLDSSRAESVVALLPETLAQYVRADAQSNSLAVSAPPQLMHRIMADVETIDMPRQHVMLDARVVVLERGDLLDFGTDFQWPSIEAGTRNADDDSWPYEVRIGYTPSRSFTNALSLTLNFLSANRQATIIASPQVLAQDGTTSQIRVTSEEFFEILTESETTTAVLGQLEEIETGTILSITPRVGQDGNITLEMDLEVSDVTGRGENNLPVVSRRSAQSTVTIQNGGTAAVAGLVDARAQSNRSGVPGTANLPLIGYMLGRRDLDHQARQVAIFVTAHLVDENGKRFRTGAGPTAQIRDITDEQYRTELEAALHRLGGQE
ncbi:secretin N-terminal domain-containing protein [Roseovarius salis]|uniref:secretin N-terminal domain-containing protein n=1 Tax=Roseovarius salis TaxID=3376063 RepID=UPI0037C58B8A